MLLTITTNYSPATDLGYLLHKHPARSQAFELRFGQAHVFYPEASPERCTATLLLDIDPVELARGRRTGTGHNRQPAGNAFSLQQYVNDRPYVASSFLSVAIAEVYGSALNGRCADRPELVDTPLPLEAQVSVVKSAGGEELLRRLFEPLGYRLQLEGFPLDDRFPEWGPGPYFRLRLAALVRLKDLLTHLYVLLPVLDDDKHYWVGEDEVDKLIQRGEGWLAGHPERDQIVRRYLKHQRTLMESALQQLADDLPPAGEDQEAERGLEGRIGLHQLRHQAVLQALQAGGAHSVIDLGCGEGKLLKQILLDRRFTLVAGADVSARSLERAAKTLEELPDWATGAEHARMRLFQTSLLYRDRRLEGYDAAVLTEVIEHIDLDRLSTIERLLFDGARPKIVILTTPNREYNVMWPGLPGGQFRHPDHHFEWTRDEFREWAEAAARRHGYTVEFAGIGPEAPAVGAPTQMGVFRR